MNSIPKWNVLSYSEWVLQKPFTSSSSNTHPSHLKPANEHSICFFTHNYFYAGKIYIMSNLGKTVLTCTDYIPNIYTEWTVKYKENVLHLPKQESNYAVA